MREEWEKGHKIFREGRVVCRPRADAKGVYYICFPREGRKSPPRASTGTKNEEEAKHFFLKYLEDTEESDPTRVGRFTISDCLDVHEKHVRNRGNVYGANRLAIEYAKVKEVIGDKFPEELMRKDVRDLTTHLLNFYAESTAAQVKMYLNAAINYAHEEFEDLCPRKASVKITDKKSGFKRRERWLSKEEIKRLIDASRGLRRYTRLQNHKIVELKKPKPYPNWVPLFIQLLVQTAGRISAVCELEWPRIKDGTIDLNNPRLRGKRKGRAIVKIKGELKPILEDARKNSISGVYVLEDQNGNRIRPYRARLYFHYLCLETGLNAGDEEARWRVSPHSIRHSMATHMLKGNTSMYEVSKRLGHRDIKVTQDTYAHHEPGFQDKSAEVTDEILKDIS